MIITLFVVYPVLQYSDIVFVLTVFVHSLCLFLKDESSEEEIATETKRKSSPSILNEIIEETSKPSGTVSTAILQPSRFLRH